MKSFLDKLCDNFGSKHGKVMSIAQDIISLNSNGKKRMPKNVGLGLSLKNSTRSKEFITYLNNLGHSISYDDVLRIDTTWATSILERGEGYATIPSNVFPLFFTQTASDNGDYSQESNSQHVTNTVLYQYGNFNPVRPVRVTNTQSKISFKRRSISLPHLPMEELNILRKPDLPNYFSDIRIKDISSVEKSSEWTYSSLITSSWILLRIVGNKLFTIDTIQNQKIPTWTGFRKVVTVKFSSPTRIGNCRSLPASPTDLNVVYTMLVNVRKMLVNLGQADPCVTVDESIYELAKRIQWHVPALQDVTVRLGGFHRAKNFLGIIGKRMKSTGFSEILQNADLYG